MISVKLLFIFSLPRRARESLSSYTDWASGTEITAFGREESLGKYRISRDPACRGRKWLSDRAQNWSDRQQVELYTCSCASRVPSVKKRCIWKGFFFFGFSFRRWQKCQVWHRADKNVQRRKWWKFIHVTVPEETTKVIQQLRGWTPKESRQKIPEALHVPK